MLARLINVMWLFSIVVIWICIFISIQIAEEDESSRRSSPAAERLRKQVLSKEEISETASIVESEDGVSKIQISGTEDIFKQVIKFKCWVNFPS